jgi:23S rRNA pseudouridine2604 synthase
MFETVGYRVKHLLRVRVGNLRLGDLPRGHWRALTQRELKDLEGQTPRSASQGAASSMIK